MRAKSPENHHVVAAVRLLKVTWPPRSPVAEQEHLSSLSTGIMCCEMTWGIECNVEKATGFRYSSIGLLFNKVPFDRSRLHLYPFVIATIDWWLVAEAMEPWATSVPANKWANLL